MKIELSENKVFYNENGQKKEIHPFWLRERVDGDQYVDSITKQRLFDPTQLKENVEVSKLNLSEKFVLLCTLVLSTYLVKCVSDRKPDTTFINRCLSTYVKALK